LPGDVKVVIDNDANMIDPNIGVGGYTEGKNQVDLSIDSRRKDIKEQEIFATLVHELSHAKRAYGSWYGTTLFDYLIFEGLAMTFEEEICGNKTYYPNHIRKIGEPIELIKKFKPMFNYNDEQYDYMDFIIGDKEKGIPEHSIYIMGLFIVEEYLRVTGKKSSELLLEEPKSFEKIVDNIV
jgi:uncharacterized protein YjaZ